MLGFAPANMIHDALKASPKMGTFYDVGFPGNEPEQLKQSCKKYGWAYCKMANQGTAKNWMRAFELQGKPDILVGVEPDERAPKEWFDLVVRVLKADPKMAYVGLGQSHFSTMYDYLLTGKQRIDGVHIKTYSQAPGWAMGAFSGRFLTEVGVQCDEHYGKLESLTAEAMLKAGYTWCLLDGVTAVHLKACYKYERWKVLRGDQQTQLSFDTWLKTQE